MTNINMLKHVGWDMFFSPDEALRRELRKGVSMGLAKSRFRAKARKMIQCSGTAPRMRIDRGWTCTGFSRTLSA